MKFSPLPCYLVPPGPNILLNTLFLNAVSLRSSLNVSDQVSHPYNTTGKITVLYIFTTELSTEDCSLATHSIFSPKQQQLTSIRRFLKLISATLDPPAPDSPKPKPDHKPAKGSVTLTPHSTCSESSFQTLRTTCSRQAGQVIHPLPPQNLTSSHSCHVVPHTIRIYQHSGATQTEA
jgi:hypothetical protein